MYQELHIHIYLCTYVRLKLEMFRLKFAKIKFDIKVSVYRVCIMYVHLLSGSVFLIPACDGIYSLLGFYKKRQFHFSEYFFQK
jgi:hypothetical protein